MTNEYKSKYEYSSKRKLHQLSKPNKSYEEMLSVISHDP